MKLQMLKYSMLAGGLLTGATLVGVLIGNLSGPTPFATNGGLIPLSIGVPTGTPEPANTSPMPATTTPTPTRQQGLQRQPAPQPEPTPQPDLVAAFIDYTVQSGDILFTVAEQFNTTPETIAALNPGINPESLTVGEILRIPAPVNGQ